MGASEKKYSKFNTDKLIELLVPIYEKHFSHEEIREMIKFQKSKTGKKIEQYAH